MKNKALDILNKYYGYDKFRKGQEEIINEIIKGNDVLSIMPTGGGKSICYQIPAVILDGVTVVISPLISLMKDQVDSINNIGIKSAYINSSLSNIQIEEIFNEIRMGEVKILYVAPERLESFSFLNIISNINISQIAVDEAHCVSQWGHDFRSSYKNINKFINMLKKRPIVTAFTATATEEVKEDIIKLLELQNPKVFVAGFDRDNLELVIEKGVNKRSYILDYVTKNKEQSGIIYCATRKEVDELYNALNKKGIEALRYHAGLSDIERKENQEAFVYDKGSVIIATNAFGMGIDKPNIRYVIHNNMPRTIENYYQEIGRAGRDSEESECILLFSPGDVQTQKYIIDNGTTNPFRKRNELAKLQTMIDLVYSNGCYRKFILNYFGEEGKERCDKCSSCNFDGEILDKTIDAQKVISCIYRMKRPYGIGMIVDVLRGSKNKKIVDLELNTLSTYGIMKDYSKDDLKEFINTLISHGYINYGGEYPVAEPNSNSLNIIKGLEKVLFKEERKIKAFSSNNELFDILKGIRQRIAIEEKIPPYMVFGDNTLKEMSVRLPKTSDELLDISGVGFKKIETFGEAFLNSINDYIKENEIETSFTFIKGGNLKTEEKENKKRKTNSDKKKSFEVTIDMLRDGKMFKEIAQIRDMSLNTVISHVNTYLSEGNSIDFEIDFSTIINEDDEIEVLSAIDKIGFNKLKPIKEAIRDNISYDTIKYVILKKTLG
ncbi:MAG: DNA helicase RecQ [Clostridium chrysemydis]|uniref:DNA helicase RecQ n=1 Tax=Clostridium TaxID=1485 RepID=UPI0021525F4B|nr:DNA helicase RecQ [Clostridium sp. LY3-2]MCR6515636.1 DNA helicase RecQ [Clostridium sp. LY3-2]